MNGDERQASHREELLGVSVNDLPSSSRSITLCSVTVHWVKFLPSNKHDIKTYAVLHSEET